MQNTTPIRRIRASIRSAALGLALVFGASVAPGLTTSAEAGVIAKVDLSEQRMRVYVNGRQAYSWPVSTGRKGYRTPTGTYSPKRMHTMWHSRKYNMSPMPYSIFFRGGYAVHGTNYVNQLGRTASHGCVRLHTSNARRLFNLVKQHGARNSRISINW
ncbi:MAG: L,D-transpeptidase [Pseudomonadota bacterium]